MDIIRLSSKDIKNLSKYELHSNIENRESVLYLYGAYELLKLFKDTSDNYKMNKNYILNRLFYLKEYINIAELVMPKSLVKVGGNTGGYTMDFISSNTNVGLVMRSDEVSIEDKVFLLKCIGKILLKIENDNVLRQNDFYLGDIHEGNFIYDNKNNMVRVIDIDSAYVSGMNAPDSKFLTYNDKLWDFSRKYPLDENNRHIPNYNTTILSYIYMLLNLISGEYSPDMSISNFCNMLNDLKSIGFESELLDIIFTIYLPKDNYFDFDLIDSIDPKLIYKYREIKNVKK